MVHERKKKVKNDYKTEQLEGWHHTKIGKATDGAGWVRGKERSAWDMISGEM